MSRTWRVAAAGLAAAALTAGGALTTAVMGASTAAAADVVVLENDFESDSYAPWGPRGPVTLALTDADAHMGGQALSVTGRTGDWNGPATSVSGLFEPGGVYQVEAWVKLAAGTAGSSGVHFTVQETSASGDAYTWVGGAVTITADGWAKIGGQYTMPENLTAAQLYVEAAPISGVHPSFLVDDVLVTGQSSAQTVTAADFEDGTTGDWTKSGDVTLEVVESPDGSDDGQVLAITGRDNDYEGIQSPTGIFEPGKTYELSMRARLAEGTAGSAGVRFVMKPAYTWIGNGTVTADGWTTIAGSWTAPADGDPAALQVYVGSDNLGAPYTLLVDDVLVTTEPDDGTGPEPGVVLTTDFEDGTLGGWVQRKGADASDFSLTATDTQAHDSTHAALLSGRDSEGDGIGYDVTGLLEAGAAYEVSAWVRFADGQDAGDVWLSLANTTDGTTSFATLAQFTGLSNGEWVQVRGTFTMPAHDSALLYFETAYQGGNLSDWLIDDIVIEVPVPPVVEDLTGIKETVDFPVGVAIDSRETAGSASELLLRHFDQITAENHMKPEAWYDEDRNFRPHPEAIALMDYAAANDLRLYGHVLVWHSQTPAWFFQDAEGNPLTDSEADQQVLRDRLRTHVFSIAEWVASEYGAFGSDTNPLVAFDVVNEVVSDGGEFADGLRRSEWYRILGEEFIDLSFQYADEAFNTTYAADGSDRPVELFINDYNTEQGGKQDRYYALVERLLARGVPVDGVGHQFHVSLAMPVSALDAALDRFEALPVTQAVTEFDVTTGTPVTQANLIEQGYYFRDAFRSFREHSDDLFSVTAWGLTDGRSWRSSSGAPLIFDDGFQAKPAYYGAVDGELPARLRTANVFAGDVALDDDATTSLEWSKLPLHGVEEVAEFQLRWAPDHLTAYVSVDDADAEESDAVTFELDGDTYVVGRDGSVDEPAETAAAAVASERDGGYAVVVHLPLDAAAQGDTLALDVRVTDGETTATWNTPGATGTLTLIEELSYLDVVEASDAPVIDGAADAAYDDANAVTTAKQVQGTDGALATVRTLWSDDTLYVLAEVADPVVDVSGSDPWIQDSVELYVDGGNFKNGSFRYDDTQIRISAENAVSFGTGDEAFQRGRVQSATSLVDGGYVVEAAISLLEYGGQGTFHGLDFQVNDASGGQRTSIRNWADPSGAGYQSTARWGVGQLVGPAAPEEIVNLTPPSIAGKAVKGETLRAVPGEWSVDGVTFTYRWLRDGEQIYAGNGKGKDDPALASTYKVKPYDVGHELTVEVTAHADGFEDVSAVSAPVVVSHKRS